MSHTLPGIQRAVPADEAQVVSCVHDAYNHYVKRIGRRPAPMDADYTRLIARGTVYVIRVSAEHRVDGLIVIEPQGDALFIENVAVQPSQQGHGLGRRLMAFAEQRARALGLAELSLYTHELMTENIAFYGRLGYEEIERRIEDGFARVFMRKRLVGKA